jgi:hypothetical protein
LSEAELQSYSGLLVPIAVVCFLVLPFTIGCFCAQLAHHKGYGSFAGWVSGFLFGIFALIYYAGLPDRNGH